MDNLMTEIDLEGFQVVNSQYFSTMNAPQMTIWCDLSLIHISEPTRLL